MANERKTEIITRDHFSNFLDSIYIEEQRSDNPKIDKLLKSASKKGGGKGYPEFIISYKTNPDLLIVVECKADVTKHESKDRDKYSEFAVDGALLYASYLSKGFDVLAIAVSGETKQSLKVSHFLHLRNEKKATPIFGDKFLPVDDYLNGYLKSPEKFRQDYISLLDFTKQLNEKLHTYKILESQRSLLISSILIALENPAFKRSYASHTRPEDLASSLIQTVLSELEKANITGKKLENLNTQFSFIKTDTSLSKKENILKEIIDEIDENINIFIKTHKYFDVLGQLYIEFLRYANSDKGLGIVLTPPHITELFADLAQVNKNSIAYDNCTGTGGFLISAMKRMIADAKGDETKIKEIKSKQLIGTEYQSHIFALAVSNMYIHQDGKTNIINGSCFDEEVIEEVKSRKPTVGFLNPPYKSNKKTDTDELEFILNNLECLVDGGTCVAIVPMSSALAMKGKTYEIKKELLKKHTLEAVLSMPNDLFIDSDVGTVTCIMVFTAHKPHFQGKKTFFGYFKNDGFEKRRKGRIEINCQWKDIKNEWLKAYLNKANIPDLSINIEVTANNEWCPEAYLITDFTKINNNNFIKNLKEHCIYLFNNDLSKNISNNPLVQKEININFQNWQRFKVKDFFKVYSGGDKPKSDDSKHWNGEIVNSVENQTTNNGIKEKIEFADENKIFENFISVVSIGEGGKAFYQPEKGACFTRVKVLVPIKQCKNNFNKYLFLFFCSLLDMERYRYGYGRVLSKDRLGETELLIPTKNNLPDWEFMENYIKSLPYSSSL
ncbi:MAG: N-6 DNA methylase [Patescibacteria group bacterium]